MNILFLGDIFGSPGREALAKHLPHIIEKHGISCVIANGENSANGRGITLETANDIFKAGAHVITLGDHTFDQKGAEELLVLKDKIIRPANYQQGTAGRGFVIHTTPAGQRIGVLNLQGRVFMSQQIDCPFQYAKRFVEEHELTKDYDALVVDFHAEATAEKVCLAHVFDGHATLVVGTHTHIPTADTRVLPGGTAYQTDAGMCGIYNSSIGLSFESVLPNYYTRGRRAFQPATGEASLSGVLVSANAKGLAQSVKPIRAGGDLTPTVG
ncbi:MAG TPA: TIGR00282 family metallophosphoesterase [Alphaproteobacteria bacterium]|nr:TIGR00282 family metallophosphoesterase [Alphaproteobacteria bacterium]